MSDIPVLVFDWNELPRIADNIWNAQMAGWERILTYRGPLPKAKGRGIRKQSMTYEVDGQTYRIPITEDEDRDEYPFACTVEGASDSVDKKPWVGHVPRSENQTQGAMIRAFILKHRITAAGHNSKFEVRIINHPQGPVCPR